MRYIFLCVNISVSSFQQTINDLFAEPSGLDSLVKEKEREKEAKERELEEKQKQAQEEKEKKEKEESKKEATMLTQYEQVIIFFVNYMNCTHMLILSVSTSFFFVRISFVFVLLNLNSCLILLKHMSLKPNACFMLLFL